MKLVRDKKNNKQTGVYEKKNLTGVILSRITSLLGKKGGEWIGSMSELDIALRSIHRTKLPSNWPGSPSAMRVALNNAAYYIRRSGIKVEFSRTSDHSRKRVVEFVRR